MISVSEAEKIIFDQLFEADVRNLTLKEAQNRILAEPILADRPFPPYSRVAMDGIALKYSDLQGGNQLKVQDIQLAGEPAKSLEDGGYCIEVMTGSILPQGADTVIPYEEIKIEEGRAKLNSGKLEKGQNIHLEGADARKEDELVSVGTILSTPEIGIAASVGKSELKTYSSPEVAIISTGDEIIPIDQKPKPHQVRSSNSYSIKSGLLQLGIEAETFHLPDQRDTLIKEIGSIKERFKILILIGGASKGKADHVPEVLEHLGIKKSFHGVAQRPGKPFWFGKDAETFVFGFPGNPVSAFLCFYRYVKPWIIKSLGGENVKRQAILTEEFGFKKPLTLFLQGKADHREGKTLVKPVPGGGSGDLVNLSKADGFLELPADKNEFGIWETYSWFPFR